MSDDDKVTSQEVEKGTVEKMSLHTTARKLGGDGADVTWRSSSFQTRAAGTGKARSPTVDNRVRRTISGEAWSLEVREPEELPAKYDGV